MKITSNNLPLVRNWLLHNNDDALLEMAASQNRTLSLLTALTFDPDPQVSDRAVEATGPVAERIARRDPDFVRNYLLRLFWLVNEESGGVCWRAPELIAAILQACPQFEHFRPMLNSLRDAEIPGGAGNEN